MPFLENNRGHGNGDYDNRYYYFRGESALALLALQEGQNQMVARA